MAANNPANTPRVTLAAPFAAALAECALAPTSIAVAVSGGADSMALLLLAHDYAKQHKIPLTALTVDHGLRPEAAQEAQQVARWCNARSISHHILTATPELAKGTTATQAYARELRYELISQWCETNDVKQALLAHHLGDQAETLFFRLARGSGLDGLACMAPASALSAKVRLLRPLLRFSKQQLITHLNEHGQAWIEDPSNQNMLYTRVRIRRLLAEQEDYESLCRRAGEIAKQLHNFRNALENKLASELTRCILLQNGAAEIRYHNFCQSAPEYQLRILAHIIQTLAGHEHKPRSEKLHRLHQLVLSADFKHPHALGGCIFSPPKNDVLHVKLSPLST